MPDLDALERRLAAVERALTDGHADLTGVGDLASVADRVESVESDLASLEDRTAELEAASLALRGYVGNVRSVNESVERRADAAVAAVDRLEARLPEEPPERPRRPVTRETGPPAGGSGGPPESTGPEPGSLRRLYRYVRSTLR